MIPWSATTAPTWMFTRMKRAPVAAATARAARASFFRTLTPTGRAVTRLSSATTAAMAATVAGSTAPGVKGASP